MNKDFIKKWIISSIGAAIFAVGLNLFVVPTGAYSGGFTGISQLIQTIISMFVDLPKNFEITGIIYFIINIPVIVLAVKSMSKSFVIKTATNIVIQTILLALIPIPEIMIVNDYLTCCIIGGMISGFGTGLALKSSGSCGGMDVVALYLTQKVPHFSVGKISIVINCVLFGLVYLLNSGDHKIVIYSIIFSVILNLTIDRVHTQNLSVTATIISKNDGIGEYLIKNMSRGLTALDGIGCYTGEKVNYLVMIISKYEISKLKRIVNEKDPKAFIIINDNKTIQGNYEKRLEQ